MSTDTIPRLQGKTAIVTGAGGGIGRAICLAFADEGAALVCGDIRQAVASETADRINEKLINGQKLDGFAKLLRRAQRKVEKTHFRDRMMLMHHEKERKKVQREMGQDPYLDTPD